MHSCALQCTQEIASHDLPNRVPIGRLTGHASIHCHPALLIVTTMSDVLRGAAAVLWTAGKSKEFPENNVQIVLDFAE